MDAGGGGDRQHPARLAWAGQNILGLDAQFLVSTGGGPAGKGGEGGDLCPPVLRRRSRAWRDLLAGDLRWIVSLCAADLAKPRRRRADQFSRPLFDRGLGRPALVRLRNRTARATK